jgi:hypothetical protein
MMMTKSSMTVKCTSAVAHFDGLVDTLEQYRWHHPIQHVQSYPESHWMPPSCDYLLHIALATARASANKTTMKKCTNFAGHFDCRDDAPVQYHAHCPMEEVQGFGRSHWMPPFGKYCGQ